MAQNSRSPGQERLLAASKHATDSPNSPDGCRTCRAFDSRGDTRNHSNWPLRCVIDSLDDNTSRHEGPDRSKPAADDQHEQDLAAG